MPRKSKNKGDVYGPRGRYRSSSRRASSRGNGNDTTNTHNGGQTLQIGGVTIQVSGNGEVHSMSTGKRRTRGTRKAESDSAREMDEAASTDEAFADYVENVDVNESDSECENEASETVFKGMQDFAEGPIGEGPPVEDRGIYFEGLEHPIDLSTSSGEADSENTGSESDSDAVSIADLVGNFSDGLKLEHAFPVFYNDLHDTGGSTGSKASRKQRKSSYATPGAKGKLLPGEKARLKRARVDAKRAARSEGHGFNAPSVVRELESFVQAAGDIKAFPPMNMYGLAFTQKAAGLYGLKSSAQGSGRKRFIIVRATNRTQLLEPLAQERLRDMLAAHESALDLLRPGSQAAAISRGAKASKQPAANRMPSAAKQRPRYNVPVAFMSRGVVDPYEVEQAIIEPPRCAPAPDQAALPLPVELPSSRSGLGAQPSSIKVHLEEEVSLAGQMLEPTLFVRRESEGQRSEGSTPSFMGQGLGPRAPKRTLSELGGASSSQVTVSEFTASGIDEVDELSSLPHLKPGVFTTKSQYKKAHKKRDKLARRAGRVTSGAKPGQQSRLGPESPATPMVMEASFAFGSFEQHTTGFGSRMLAKMGYEGQGSGLGRQQQGRAEPITATMRPKQLGLGAT
ncbi:g1794 [Coccomyxa viridis]|uniref:G1794 protein n=1 Tax=Coccomyxa viridis TaxID=1274662 RepID=A0ABP1FMK6_9CHLO